MSRALFVCLSLFCTLSAAADCVGRWGAYAPCPGACGAQSETKRHYEILSPATGYGKACEYQDGFCDPVKKACTVECPQNDGAGKWVPGECVSKGVCGSDAGQRTLTYVVEKPQGPGGKPCEAAAGATKVEACSAAVVKCVDCVGEFGPETPCVSSGQCDSSAGRTTRTYKITTPAGPGGKACPFADGYVMNSACNSAPVVPCVHCKWTEEAVGSCVSDGVCNSEAGKQSFKFVITQQPGSEAGCRKCPTDRQDGQVFQKACQASVTPCKNCVGSYSEWSPCKSAGQCGSSKGSRTRTYSISEPGEKGGKSCPCTHGQVLTEECAADVTPCVGCQGSWSEWSPCESKGVCSSDAGTQSRTYTVTVPGEAGGAKCPASDKAKETRSCSAPVTPCAPEDCEGAFGAFSKCKAKTCGSSAGTQSRTFKVTKAAKYGGKACEFANGFVDTADCECASIDVTPCPQNCVADWEATPCVSAGVCGSDKGYVTETCRVRTPAAYGGTPCPAANGAQRRTRCKAEITPCPPENCQGEWVTGKCSCQCGTTKGEATSVFKVTKPARYGGVDCEAQNGASRIDKCTSALVPCPVACAGTWTEFTPCESLGRCSTPAGTQQRTFVVATPAAHGGAPCNHQDGYVQKVACNTAPITPCPPIPCVGSWTDGPCKPNKCGTTSGTKEQVFRVTVPDKYDGKPCEATNGDKRNAPCTAVEQPCPVDCVGSYSEWSACKALAPCGSTAGTKTRSYSVSTPSAFGGAHCPRADKQVETQSCEAPLVPCPPVDCVGSWSAPTQCEQTACDKTAGTQKSQFSISVNAAYGGKECEAKSGAVKTLPCNLPEKDIKRCPINCEGSWSDKSKCEPLNCGCANGLQKRTYKVTRHAAFGGAACPTQDGASEEFECQCDAKDVKRCHNAFLDHPCVELDQVIARVKHTRCSVEALLDALNRHDLKKNER